MRRKLTAAQKKANARRRSITKQMNTLQKRADKIGEKIYRLTTERDALVYKFRNFQKELDE